MAFYITLIIDAPSSIRKSVPIPLYRSIVISVDPVRFYRQYLSFTREIVSALPTYPQLYNFLNSRNLCNFIFMVYDVTCFFGAYFGDAYFGGIAHKCLA